MSKNLVVHVNKKPAYDIMLESDFSHLAEAVMELGFEESRIVIVSDEKVGSLYQEAVKEALEKEGLTVLTFTFPEGEASKSLATAEKLYRFLIENHVERKDLLAALGGGVTGDLTGFVAATYLRGISYIQIPTTLLAQVDSSIGGKCGVDFEQYKNMVGAFKMPGLVYINTATLQTLDERQFAAGMGEVIKYGCILDKDFYQWLKSHKEKVLARDTDTLETMIYKSCDCKRSVVEEDPNEQGRRAILNYGHTFGHAIEKLKNFELLHGECVALGMVAASFLSVKRGIMIEGERRDLVRLIKAYGLPVSTTGLSASDVIAVTASDKKRENGVVRFILTKGIGEAVIDRRITSEDMEEALVKTRVLSEA